MNRKYTIQLTLIALIYFISNINSLFLGEEQTLPYKCSDSDRKKDCNGSTERTVCGWFNDSIKCFRYPCAITAKSVCEACNNENVAEVTDKDCEKQDDKPVSNTESSTSPPDEFDDNSNETKIVECTEKQRSQDIMCTEEWLPVCGYKEKTACADNSKACLQNYGNNCSACRQKEVMYTVNGECPVYKDDTDTDTRDNTEEVKYTITGKEDDSAYAELHFCSTEEQEVKSCDGVKNEDICGFTSCDGDDGCPKDFTNNCLACKASDIMYTTAGKCKDVPTESIRLQYLALTAGVADLNGNSSSFISVLGYGITAILLLLSF